MSPSGARGSWWGRVALCSLKRQMEAEPWVSFRGSFPVGMSSEKGLAGWVGVSVGERCKAPLGRGPVCSLSRPRKSLARVGSRKEEFRGMVGGP